MAIELLPHEIGWLQAKLLVGLKANMEVSDEMAHAIETGNQWHDNPAYDGAIERMKLIDATYKPVVEMLGNAVEADYPTDIESIALGSLVRLKDEFESYSALVVGSASLGEDDYSKLWASVGENDDDLTLLSAEAPMGAALVGSEAGSTVTWEVEAREFSVDVLAVDNRWLAYHIQSLATN